MGVQGQNVLGRDDRLAQAYEESNLLFRLARLLNCVNEPGQLLSIICAQIQQILRKLGTPLGIEVRGAEFGPVKPLGADYGEAPVSVSFDCAIEQLVNFLSSLGNQPEILGTSDIRVTTGNPKDKRIGVRLTVSGVVSKKLIPEKKGITSF